jgi:hypothetical protein
MSGWNFNASREDSESFEELPLTETRALPRFLPFDEEYYVLDQPCEGGAGDGGEDKEGIRQGDPGNEEDFGVKGVVVPHLMTIFGSLEVQKRMLTQELEGGCYHLDGNCCRETTAREEMLMAYVRQLEERVEVLTLEVEEEITRNAHLEELLHERAP